MNEPEFSLYYDAAVAFNPWPHPVVIVFITAMLVGSGAFAFVPSFGASWLGKFMFGFAVLWSVLAFWVIASDKTITRDASIEGSCETISGPVEDYERRRKSRSSSDPRKIDTGERFSVEGVEFHVARFRGAGFDEYAAIGGPIHRNAVVRICYINLKNQNVIVRLEIAETRENTRLGN